jgi:hypothetical protein
MTVAIGKLRCSMRAVTRASVFLFMVLIVLSSQARAADRDAWVGVWYVEVKEDGDVYGKKYNIRRELIVNRADGSKVNTFRYYQSNRIVTEVITTYSRWGVDNGVYWTDCQAVLHDGAQRACSAHNEYAVVSVTPREIRYKSKQTGILYAIQRVTDSFRLP